MFVLSRNRESFLNSTAGVMFLYNEKSFFFFVFFADISETFRGTSRNMKVLGRLRIHFFCVGTDPTWINIGRLERT